VPGALSRQKAASSWTLLGYAGSHHDDVPPVYSGDGYSPTIVGGHRDDYIRNFAPATPTSVIYEVTGGKLEYTTFTRYDDNNFLTLQYGNLPAADQLNLNLENEKAAGSFRFALAAAAPPFDSELISTRKRTNSKPSYYSTMPWSIFQSETSSPPSTTARLPTRIYVTSITSLSDQQYCHHRGAAFALLGHVRGGA
jgi:hypothetical protein